MPVAGQKNKKSIKRKNQPLGLRHIRLVTRHGVLHTPFFMPDATRALVKLLSEREVKATGTQALVVNTFHLYLQPGLEIIKAAGGLHKFMNWSGPLLSDSGGFQVFSLIHKNKNLGKILDDKVIFRSPLDGSRHELSPEKSIQIQFDLGTDMMVCLDDCPPNDFKRPELEMAVARTIAWAKRCKLEYARQIKRRGISKNKRPLLFAVIQGGAEIDLREYCAQELVKIGFDGYGFGARPVDKDGQFLQTVLSRTAKFIPTDKLRFALGIGTPLDIKRCARMGWDMFDCVIPTREGRHGRLFIGSKTININNTKFTQDFKVINAASKLPELKSYSRAYLNHLFKIKDPLGSRLAALNNLEFYQTLFKNLQ